MMLLGPIALLLPLLMHLLKTIYPGQREARLTCGLKVVISCCCLEAGVLLWRNSQMYRVQKMYIVFDRSL